MSTARKLRRGTAAENAAFTGAVGELVHTTDDDRLAIHNGSAAGGVYMPNYRDIQNNSFGYALVTGTADALIASTDSAPSGLQSGMSVKVKIASNNTGSATLNWDSAGVKTIKKYSSGSKVNLSADDLVADQIIELDYDGTDYVMSSGGAGVWEDVATADISSAASVDFADIFDAGYVYDISLSDMTPATDAVDLYMRLSTDGSTFISTAIYEHAGFVREFGGTEFNIGSNGDNQVNFNGATSVGNQTNESFSGNILYSDPAKSGGYANYISKFSFIDPSENSDIGLIGGALRSTSPVVGLQFYFSSGNIANGKITIKRKALP